MAKRSKKKWTRSRFRGKLQRGNLNKARKSNKRQVYKQSRISRFSYRLMKVSRKLKKGRKKEPKYWQEILQVIKKIAHQKLAHQTKLEKKRAKAKTPDNFVGPQKTLMESRIEQNRQAALTAKTLKSPTLERVMGVTIGSAVTRHRPQVRFFRSYVKTNVRTSYSSCAGYNKSKKKKKNYKH